MHIFGVFGSGVVVQEREKHGGMDLDISQQRWGLFQGPSDVVKERDFASFLVVRVSNMISVLEGGFRTV